MPGFQQTASRCTLGILLVTLFFTVFWGFGCSKPASPPAPVVPVKESPPSAAPTENASQKSETAASDVPSGETLARIQAVDQGGKPLAGLIPIANLQPNAFDEPFAKGAPTDSNGMGTVSVPSNKKVFVRVWDPSLRLFANNYLDVPSETESTQVQMIMGATFEVTLITADGKPVQDIAVSMMMVHPRVGPWWPGESVTDKNGKVSFGPVPAGKFNLLFQTKSAGKAEVPEVILMPGERRDLRSVRLQ